jgi:glycogen debranching enzyme
LQEAGTRILRSLSESQGTKVNDETEEQPGKIPHEVHEPEDLTEHVKESNLALEDGRSYSGFDQTFLFIVAYRRFAELFPQAEIVEEGWPHVVSALRWIEEADEDGDGFFEYSRRGPRNLLNQVWKDSFDSCTHTGFDSPPHPVAWVEVQGYAFRALVDAAGLLERRGETSPSENLRRRAVDLKSRFNRLFWLDSEEYFAMALDGEKRPVKMIASNPSHALWAGIISDEHVKLVVKRLIEDDMLSTYGLRTLSDRSPFFAPFAYHRGSVWPFDNAVSVLGLVENGFREEAKSIIDRVSNAIFLIGSPIEAYAVVKSSQLVSPSVTLDALAYRQVEPLNRNQAWTAAALMYFGAVLDTL